MYLQLHIGTECFQLNIEEVCYVGGHLIEWNTPNHLITIDNLLVIYDTTFAACRY